MKLPNLFTFFFTHLGQSISEVNKLSFYLYSYLNFENLAITEDREHGFYFVVSNNQPTGLITINTLDYESTLTTPFNNYEFEEVSLSQTGLINPLLIQPIDYESNVDLNNATVLATITVDTDIINVASTNFPDIYLTPSTIDRDNYIFYKNNNVAVDLDSVVSANSNYLVSIDNVPGNSLQINWLLPDNKLSKLWCPSSKRGYLPSSTLDTSMPSVTLKEIALSLITLISYQNDYLILSTLRELAYTWKNNVSVNKNGLPSILQRYQDNSYVYTKARDTADLALLGYAVTCGINYLRDKNIDKITPINEDIISFVDNLCETVCSLINKSAGYASLGYDSNGEILDEQSHGSLIIAQIFLHKYLSIKYSYFTHSVCNASYLSISNKGIRRGNFQDLIYKLYWNLIYDQHFDSQDIYYRLKAQISQTDNVFILGTEQSNTVLGTGVNNDALGEGVIKSSLNLNDFHLGLWVLCQQLITTKEVELDELITLPPLEQLYLQRQNELYSSTSSPQEKISLLASSWYPILTNENSLIRNTPDFVLYAEPSLAHHAFGFQESKRMLPFGYKWAGIKSEEAFTGILGSYLYSLSFPTRDWFLAYSLLKNGRYLSTSQGYALDNWGYTINLPRPDLQSDDFYRENIKYFLGRAQCTTANLNQLVNNIYSERLDLLEVLPNKYKDGLYIYPFAKTQEVIRKVQEVGTVLVNKPYYPSNSIISDGKELQVEWEQYLPRLEVIIDSSIPNLEKTIRNEISAGINVVLFLRQKHIVNSRPFTFIQTNTL